MPSTEAACAQCGARAEEGTPPESTSEIDLTEAVTSLSSGEGDALSSIDAIGPESDEPPSVPAGTWASTSQSGLPPEPNAFAHEPETRRIKRPRDERERENDREPSRPVRAARVVVRGRSRGLAVAASPLEEAEREPARDRPDAQVVAFPGQRERAGPAPAKEESQAGLDPPPPPRYLASELLRDPPLAEPYGWTARTIGASGGIAGAAASLVLGPPDLAMAGIFAVIAGLAVLPLPFSLRSGGFAVAASIGLAIATWKRTGGAEGESIGLAIMGTTLLAAAQLLRAIQRRSKFARVAMAVGVIGTAAWLVLDGGLDAMVVRDNSIEAWLGPLVRAALTIVLSLSLLGFLDDQGTSGTRVWPWLVLGWSALEALLTIAMLGSDEAVATAATPVFSAVAALGWMQLWATTPGLGLKESSGMKGTVAKGDG